MVLTIKLKDILDKTFCLIIILFILSLWLIIPLTYISLFILTYGITLADIQNDYPIIAEERCREQKGDALMFSLFTPISTIIAYLGSGFAEHGIQFKCNYQYNEVKNGKN
ncbi:hypothetical protein M0R04_11040 [Candidatus Dojkabacteria bacterium]|jgi:hypothetical protein|nr:hypothetical protein [Candidatus Dojkabacteria bacterium]